MKFVLPYKIFEEAKLIDSTTIITNPDVLKRIEDTKDDITANFITRISLGTRLNGKKIRLNMKYHDKLSHDLRDRIFKRAGISSIKEFNEVLITAFNKTYPLYLNTANIPGDYNKTFSMFFENALGGYNSGFSILYSIKFLEEKKREIFYNVLIITIMPNRANNYDKEFIIKI